MVSGGKQAETASDSRSDREGSIDGDLQLTLYVSGASTCSTTALLTLRRLCEGELAGRVHLEVVDIHRDPEGLVEDQIVAIPTLIKRQPLPQRRVVGDLRDEERLRAALDLPPRPPAPRGT